MQPTMSVLTYLITGANRGIGKGLLEVFLARPQNTVIAAVRDVEKSTSVLKTAVKGKDSKLMVMKIDSSSDTDAAAAVAELESKHGISKIDVLVANAGLFSIIATTLKTPAKEVRAQFDVNTVAPLILIQAFFPLLEKSAEPKFFVISSTIGSMGEMETLPVPFFGYGLSKAAVNYMVRKLHFENPNLTSMTFNPGWVQTDIGNGSAETLGMTEAPTSLKESVDTLVALFDSANREKSGTFTSGKGETVKW